MPFEKETTHEKQGESHIYFPPYITKDTNFKQILRDILSYTV